MPRQAHATHLQKILETAAGAPPVVLRTEGGKILAQPDPVRPDAPPPPPVQDPPPADPGAPAAEPPPAASPPPPAAGDRSARLSKAAKSVAIERRAETTRQAAREEAAAARREREAATTARRTVERKESQLQTQAEELQSQIRLLKTDPFQFMASHGVGKAQIADYARSGASPVERRLDMLEQGVQEQIQKIAGTLEKKLNGVVQQITETQEAEANEAFLDHVNDDDRFEALQTMYSPEELLRRANTLAEKNARLRLGWDGDRLCEELEAQARKDPRWAKLTKRYEKRPKTAKPNDPASAATNARTPDQGTTRQAPREQAAADEAPRLRGASPQRDDGVRRSPSERHRQHVERLARSGRF